MLRKQFPLLLSLLIFLSVNAELLATKPRYSAPDSAAPLEVFIIPHSHDDVGWIVTMNQYFEAEVQYIYDTVVDKLMESVERRFSIVEVGFLKLWWDQANDQQRSNLKFLHGNGQVEFLIGGIVMNDEAAASYEAIINQMQEGHKFLLEEFGATPKIGWQVDPFGSSRGTPTISAWDCFDAMITARIPYLWKDALQNNQSLEFVWHGTDNLGQETNLFTHIMDEYGYCTAGGFGFGDGWNIYSPPNPNPPINEANVEKRADALVDNFIQRSAWFATNNLMWPFGCDFNYQNADTMFKNMDKLIKYINDNSATYNINVRYAHVQDYFNAVYKANRVWPEYSGDFFPYNDDSVSYWTGYFSSRNALKIQSRQADAVLRTADITSVLTGSLSLPFNLTSSYEKLDKLRLESAVSQHHDGISGTARPNVVKDYVFRLDQGIAQCANQTIEMIQTLATAKSAPVLSLNASSSIEILSSNKVLTVVVYNSLPYDRDEFVWVLIPFGLNVSVTNSTNFNVPSQIDQIINDKMFERLYIQTHTNGLGFSTYFVTPFGANSSNFQPTPRSIVSISPSSATLSNQDLSLKFSNGQLQYFNTNSLGPVQMTSQILQYTESDNPEQSGGAYIFRNRDNAEAVPILSDTSNPSYYYQSTIGPFVQSFTQVYSYDVSINANHLNEPCAVVYVKTDVVSTNTTQTFKVYNLPGASSNSVEVGFDIGPVEGNRDVIVRYSTPNITGPLNSNLFYQDDNGFITMQRTFNTNQSLLIPGNYYPVVNSAYVQDNPNDIRFTTLTSHSHGGASLAAGQLEIVLHRRTLQDDSRGVSCPLDDISRLSFKHRITLNTTASSEQIRQRNRLELNNPLTLLFGSTTNPENWVSQYVSKFAPMTASLPVNVYLLSLQYYGDANEQVILRLQHLFEAGSDSVFAAPVTIDINSIFTNLQFSSVVELSISANQNYEQCSSSRLVWNTQSSQSSPRLAGPSKIKRAPTVVTLQPGQIKTFSAYLS